MSSCIRFDKCSTPLAKLARLADVMLEMELFLEAGGDKTPVEGLLLGGSKCDSLWLAPPGPVALAAVVLPPPVLPGGPTEPG